MSSSPARYACLPRPRLEENGVWIETIQPGDIESIRLWRNAQLEVLRQPAPITPEQQQAYFAAQIWPTLALAQPCNILVSYHAGERLIGYGGLVHIAWEHKRAEISFLLDPVELAPKEHYAMRFKAFLGLMKTLAFKDLGFTRLFTETYALRPDHIAVLESAGFVREGVMRQHVRINGVGVDSLLHGCLCSDQTHGEPQ
jgi:RimJ/RimL family protein N-acetyltransferase